MGGDRVAEAGLVGSSQIVERLDHAGGADAGRLDVARFVHAGGDQDRVMPLAQLGQARVAAHFEAQVELDPCVLEPLDAAHDDRLLQLEAGNAIGQQAAGAVMPVIDMHFMARDAQIFRRREPGRTPRR